MAKYIIVMDVVEGGANNKNLNDHKKLYEIMFFIPSQSLRK